MPGAFRPFAEQSAAHNEACTSAGCSDLKSEKRPNFRETSALSTALPQASISAELDPADNADIRHMHLSLVGSPISAKSPLPRRILVVDVSKKLSQVGAAFSPSTYA